MKAIRTYKPVGEKNLAGCRITSRGTSPNVSREDSQTVAENKKRYKSILHRERERKKYLSLGVKTNQAI